MKKCCRCQEEKDELEFNLKGEGKRHSHCKSCQSESVKKHYLNNKQKYKTKALINNRSYNERNRIFLINTKEIRDAYSAPRMNQQH